MPLPKQSLPQSPWIFSWSTKFKSASSCRNCTALWHTDPNNPFSTWHKWYKLPVIWSWQLKHILILFSSRLMFNFTSLGETLTNVSFVCKVCFVPFFAYSNLIYTKSEFCWEVQRILCLSLQTAIKRCTVHVKANLATTV